MLPKLAELWEARKIMYFVATNHIEYFDRAVTRSQRFDAIIFMSPPSFAAKKNRLIEILQETYHVQRKITFSVQKSDIDGAKPTTACSPISTEPDKGVREILESREIPEENALFKFALLRYDELGELARHLRSLLGKGSVVTKEMLKNGLLEIKDGSWRNLGEYDQYLSDPAYERRDFTKCSAWIVVNRNGIGTKRPAAIQTRLDGTTILVAPANDSRDLSVPGYTVESAGPGKVRLIKT
jgi:hypothetical protein